MYQNLVIANKFCQSLGPSLYRGSIGTRFFLLLLEQRMRPRTSLYRGSIVSSFELSKCNTQQKKWKVSKSYYAMFIIKALMMTPLECIFAYRILPLFMRSWVGDRSNPKDPVVLRGGEGGGGLL